jgi:hypothetical protein
MKKLLLVLAIISASIQIAGARGFEGLSVGFDGGYSISKSFDSDVFLKANFNFGDRFRFEPKFGFFYGSYELDHYGFNNLETETGGIFIGVDMLPFNDYLTVGFRLDVLSYNRFTDASRERLRYIDYKREFGGSNLFANIGYEFPVSSRFAVKIAASPGIRLAYMGKYNVEYSGGITVKTSETPVTTFDCPFTIGLVYKIFQKKTKKS